MGYQDIDEILSNKKSFAVVKLCIDQSQYAIDESQALDVEST